MRGPTDRPSWLERLALLLLFALPAALPDSAFAQTLAVRFHPAGALHAYPLESTRNLQGVLLQNIVVANTGSVPLALTGVELRVKGADGVTDIRRLGPADLQRSAASGARLQAAGLIDALDFQFGGAKALGPAPRLAAGTALAAGETLLIGHPFMSFRGDGTRLADYHAYGAEVLAAATGVVRAVQDTVAETADDLRRPGEDQLAYLQRVGESQMELMARGANAIPGNFVLIEHAGGESSLYAHLQRGSVRVKVGDRVEAGQPIGRLGSSGNSTEPHLHFHVCDQPAVMHCAGVPVVFDDIELPCADAPRPLQTGDVVVTR